MVALIDYGVGNLFSIQSSLAAVGAETTVTGDAARIRAADALLLPGVGAFADAARKLRASGLDRVIVEQAAAGKPLLGICLGMQLLFTESLEFGRHAGLGLIPGVIRPIRGAAPAALKVPHIGWNALQFPAERHRLFADTPAGACVYFVHSYFAADCAPYVTAETEYGIALTAGVAKGNIMGCQFHPEKSGPVGLSILKNFCKEAQR